MVKLEHPNGCVHDVREDLVSKFLAAGWMIKAAPAERPFSSAETEPEQKKRKPRKKKQ